MGFLLKLIFVYFLIKFLWSLFRGAIIKKLNNKIVKEMNNAMKNQNQRRHQSKSSYDNAKDGRSNSASEKGTFEADYKVIKK